MCSADGERKRRFELGCGHVMLVGLVTATIIGLRFGYLERRRQAAEDVKQLGGTVIYGKDRAAQEWLQAWFPAEEIAVHLGGTAATNDDILAVHQAEKVNLIISQLNMPGMKSERLYTAIRKNGELRQVSLIMLHNGTPGDTSDDVTVASNVGFFDWVA